KTRIRKAISYWQSFTCIRFKEIHTRIHTHTNTHNIYIYMCVCVCVCWSYVGFTGQFNQTISVGDGCQSNGTIAHEIGHSIGLWHEQSRPDRDLHVSINEVNVADGKLFNFRKRTWGEVVTHDVPYDLGSNMHYGSKYYAKDPNVTLTTVQTRDPLMSMVIGQREELSFYDVKMANIAY
ncbi:hypothetical protein HELRODRAFT_124058, partial [Helobdella robusta]|uniref:Metalloendopeptidase n=1 Tax=Helobdella robusta TaxID=6412 RepID=T1EH00_HELRO